jgi:Ca-activated chloride channel family protein
MLMNIAGLTLAGATVLVAAAAVAQPMIPRFFPPQIRVPEAEKPIEVAALDVHVVIHGLNAETTQTVTFFNPNSRVLEGDLEFPLPDGATVSGFALDVGGQLVDGVVVAKDQARVILEAEIRKGIDPGLVEQVRGNLYRARIYPIPARGTRTVRLRWVSELTTRGLEAAYHLPMPYDRPIAEVAMRIEVVQGSVEVKPELDGGFGNLALKQWEDRWVAEAKWHGAAPTKDLLVTLPRLPEQLIAIEPGDGHESFFSVSVPVPSREASPAKAPHRLALAWDASGSRTPEATERELRFLEALLTAWPQTAVDLVVFRDHPERPVAFAAGDQGKKLIEALRQAPVDGGTALAALDLSRASLPNPEDKLWLLASDGLATLGEALPLHGDVPVWTVSGSSVADHALLRQLSVEGGGQWLDLIALDAAAATAALTRPGIRLLSTHASSALADVQISERADRTRATVTGRLLAEQADLTLVFGDGSDSGERRVIKLRRAQGVHAGEGAGPVATAWAQGQAEKLALFADRNADALLSLGRRFSLVTAGTSLLVLETLEQHLQHGVEPAASRPELRQQYLAQIGEREQQKKQEGKDHLEEVVQLWQARIDWWSTDYHVPKGWRWQDEEATEQRSMRRDGIRAPAPSAMDGMSVGASSLSRPAPAGAGAPASKDRAESESADASIAIKPWDPAVPYLEPLRHAAPGAAYAAYLAEREKNAGPAFFLDCAEFFLRAGDKALGLRVLSNLAELRLDDPALLRVFAWRLSQAGELDVASGILEKVLRLRPEEPQSKRDLALVLFDRAEAQNRPADADRALGLLYDVVQRRWDRFPEIELIALMEINRIIARSERRSWGSAIHANRVDSRLRKLLDVDLRVSLSWDADNTDVDLHLFEPTGEHAFFSHNRTTIGGLVSHDLTQGYGPEEYLVRRAVAGDYGVKVHYYGSRQQTLIGPATVTATVFTNWGRANEKRQTLTLRLDSPRDMEEVGVVTIGAGSSHPTETTSAPHGKSLAAFQALRRDMSVDAVTTAVGQPDTVGGTDGVIELSYRLDDGSEVRVTLASETGVRSVRHSTHEAEVELLP